jgi:hypothetical protein
MAQWVGQLQLEKLETPLFATGLLVAILWLLKARRNSVAAQNNEPPVLPYWIPWLGNALSYAFGSEKVFSAARYVLQNDIPLDIHSTRHSRIYTPGQGPVSIVLGGKTVYVRLVLNG